MTRRRNNDNTPCKTEIVRIRIEKYVTEEIEKYAEENVLYKSQVAQKILREWAKARIEERKSKS